MEVVVTTGAISRAKLQSNHHHQQTSTQFFYRPDALPVAQPTASKHWREIEGIVVKNIIFYVATFLGTRWFGLRNYDDAIELSVYNFVWLLRVPRHSSIAETE